MNQFDNAHRYYQEAFEVRKQLDGAQTEKSCHFHDNSTLLNQVPKGHKEPKFINKKSFK